MRGNLAFLQVLIQKNLVSPVVCDDNYRIILFICSLSNWPPLCFLIVVSVIVFITNEYWIFSIDNCDHNIFL